MKFKLYTMCWGKKHIEMFRDACFMSLTWPKNKAAIGGSPWYFFTHKEHFEEVHEIFRGSGLDLRLVDIGETHEIIGIGTVPTKGLADNFLLLRGLLWQMQGSLQTRERMLLAPPDTIFGDGTVANLLSAGRMPGSTVQVGHVRVNPTILNDIKYCVTENANLVDLAMNKHLHLCWKRSESESPEQATFKTGVIWKHIGSNVFEVKHQLPTTYLVDFTPDDWQYWSGTISFGAYDHQWPGECFIRQERQRYIGSSDACFIVEITDEDKNTGEITPKDLLNQVGEEMYFNWRLHNSVNKQFLSYFRGEKNG